MRLFLILPLALTAAALPFAQAEPLPKSGDSVAFLGDSITQQGAQKPGGYVRLVEEGLKANGINITVIPAGVSGNKSNDMLKRLKGSVIDKKPTWMTLSCGVNDVWHSSRGAGVSLEDYQKNITQIVDQAQQAGIKVVMLTATLIGPKTDDKLNTMARPYNEFLRKLAAERNLPLADLNAAMIEAQGPNGEKAKLTGDGVHMNYEGDKMMATGVLKAFGLNDGEIAKAQASWRQIPTQEVTLLFTEDEMTALKEAAAAKEQKLPAYLKTLATGTGKAPAPKAE